VARLPFAVVPGLPAACGAIVARAMAKSPADRYPHAGALADDLERQVSRQQRRKLLIGAVVLLALLLLSGLAGLLCCWSYFSGGKDPH
jgi:hypothetical protein